MRGAMGMGRRSAGAVMLWLQWNMAGLTHSGCCAFQASCFVPSGALCCGRRSNFARLSPKLQGGGSCSKKASSGCSKSRTTCRGLTVMSLAVSTNESATFLVASQQDMQREQEARGPSTAASAARKSLFRTRRRKNQAPEIPKYGNALVVSPGQEATGVVIWLDGLDYGDGPAKWSRRLRRFDLDWCRLVLPSGYVEEGEQKTFWRRERRKWFDEKSDEGLASTLQYVQTLVSVEMKKGIPSDRIIIGGSGQGATVAMLAGILLSVRLAGIICIGGQLPETIAALPSGESLSTPFFFFRSPDDFLAQEAYETLSHVGFRAEVFPPQFMPGGLGASLSRWTRRWRPWGSRCREAVEDFILRALPEDVEAIPEVDLALQEDGKSRSGSSPTTGLARFQRFVPLWRLRPADIKDMSLVEVQVSCCMSCSRAVCELCLQVCMQLHGIRYDDVRNDREARERLFAAAKLAGMKRSSEFWSAGRKEGFNEGEQEYQDPSRVVQNIADRAWFMGKDIAQGLGSAVQDEEVRRDIFQKAWNAGATAAKYATEAATDEDARSRAAESFMRAGKSAADYARASFSNPDAARKIAETAWEAGRAAADYVQTAGTNENVSFLSAEEWYDRYNRTGSADVYGESIDYSLEEERRTRGGGGSIYYKDDPFGTDDYRSAVDSAAMGIGDAARKGVGWINSIFQDPVGPPAVGSGYGQWEAARRSPPRPRPIPYPSQASPPPGSTQFSFLQDPVASSIRTDIASSAGPSRPPRASRTESEGEKGEQLIQGTGPLLSFDFKVYGLIEQASFAAAIAYKARELGISGTCNITGGEVEGKAEGKAEKAEEFIQWLCSVGAPGSVIEGTLIENQTRGEARQFDNFGLSYS